MSVSPNQRRAAKGLGGIVLASAGLLAFLGDWEGRDRTVYADKLAGGLPTGCNGITKHTSPYPLVVGDVWSEERCDEVLKLVVTRTQLRLEDCLTVKVSQNTFDALSSHAHNFGVAATCASRAVGLINGGQLQAGCMALSQRPDGSPAWSYATPSPGAKPIYVRGLNNRRKAETALCLKP